jgi:branched-chain amino acid transport system ATP-binding protein
MDLLAISNVTKRFGDFTAIDDLTVNVPGGRVTAVIGPNGAGKTTLINLVTGAILPDSGEIRFRGEPVTRLAIHDRVRKGLSRSFQIMNVFARLSVLENILVPVLSRRGRTARALHDFTREDEAIAEARALIEEIGLSHQQDVAAGMLSHGDQRLLELGIAVATRPELCFLDEPSSGLTPVERGAVLALVRKLSAEQRTTFVIVEHDMDAVFALADWIVVLNRGQLLAAGTPAEIRERRDVREIYLGEEALT